MGRSRRLDSESKLESYYIKTTGGNVVYGGDEIVTVQVSPQTFLEKKVEDLNTGERVVYDVNSVCTTLEDIVPYLPRSPMYKRASQYVLRENSKGNKIPNFRISLFSALSKKGVVSSENLEEKLLNEDTDFSKSEYDSATDAIREYLLESDAPEGSEAHVPKYGTIENWLHGLTLAPRDHATFKVLQRALGEDFDQFISTPDDPNGFYRNYRTYCVIRQNIMKTLNSWRGLSKGDENEVERNENKIDITKEIDLIRSHFLKDITHELKSVMVTEIEGLSKNKRYNIKRNDKFIRDGIITNGISELQDNLVDYGTVMSDFGTLQSYVNLIVNNSPSFSEFGAGIMNLLDSLAIPDLFTDFGEPLDAMLQTFIDAKSRSFKKLESDPNESVRDIPKKFQGAVEQLRDGILNYDLDKYYEVEDGSCFLLLESYFRVRKTVPKKIFDYLVLRDSNESTKKKFKKFGIKDPLSLRQIKKRYGVEFNQKGHKKEDPYSLVDTVHNLVREFNQTYNPRLGIDGDVLDELSEKDFVKWYFENNPQMIRFLVNNVKKKGAFFRTRQYTYDILAKYNLEQITELGKENFLLEGSGIDFPRPPGY